MQISSEENMIEIGKAFISSLVSPERHREHLAKYDKEMIDEDFGSREYGKAMDGLCSLCQEHINFLQEQIEMGNNLSRAYSERGQKANAELFKHLTEVLMEPMVHTIALSEHMNSVRERYYDCVKGELSEKDFWDYANKSVELAQIGVMPNAN